MADLSDRLEFMGAVSQPVVEAIAATPVSAVAGADSVPRVITSP